MTMTDAELIKQWDEYIESMGSVMGAVEHMAQQMRDRIEELVTERDELGRKLNTARYGQPDFAWSIHEEAMADLQAKLAKAVKAFEEIKRYSPCGDSRRKAVDTLAELKAYDHD